MTALTKKDQTSKHIFYKSKWAIPEKIQTGKVEDIVFWNPPGIFHFFTLPPDISDKESSTPGYSTKCR